MSNKFKVKKMRNVSKEEFLYMEPNQKKDWLLAQERRLGIGKNMQTMSPDTRYNVVLRKQKEKEWSDKIDQKREKENKEMQKRALEWKKKMGMEKPLY